MEAAFLKYGLPALFLLAQALLVVLNLLKNKEQNKKQQNPYRYNPHPPGEAQACRDHKAALARLGEKIENQGEDIARIEESQKSQEKRLDWIQVKLNGK